MKEDIAFIRGYHSPAEAADVLLSVLNDKIKYHRIKLLDLRHEETGQKQVSADRIIELKEAKRTVERLVVQAHQTGMYLEIESIIAIKLISNRKTGL